MDITNTKLPHILFVVNPVSGSIDKARFLDKLPAYATQYQFSYSLFHTSGSNDREKLSKAVEELKPDSIGAAGGDGTCNLVGNVIIGKSIPMFIIPFGSANGLAREFGIPSDIEDALDIAMHGTLKAIDCLYINEYVCLHLADIGFNAKLIRRSDAYRKRGLWSYVRGFFKELISSRPYPFTLNANGRSRSFAAHMLAIANATRYGTGAIINPHGKMDDGFFEICLINYYSLLAIFKLILAFFTGKIHRQENVTIISCREAFIHNPQRQMLQIDGEAIGRLDKIHVSVKSQAVLIKVPKKAK